MPSSSAPRARSQIALGARTALAVLLCGPAAIPATMAVFVLAVGISMRAPDAAAPALMVIVVTAGVVGPGWWALVPVEPRWLGVPVLVAWMGFGWIVLMVMLRSP